MLLIYGSAGLGLAALLFGITLIGSRNPQEPGWANDFLVANLYVPVMIGLSVLSIGCLFRFFLSFSSQTTTLKDIAAAIGIAATSLALLKLMRIKQRLAGYEVAQGSAEIIKPPVFFTEQVEGEKPEPPAKPTSGRLAA